MAELSDFNACVKNYVASMGVGGDQPLPSIPLKRGDVLTAPKEVQSKSLGTPEWRKSTREYVKYSLTLEREGKKMNIWLSLGQIFRFALPGLWQDEHIFRSREGARGRENALFNQDLDLRTGDEVLKALEGGITLEGIFPSKDGKRKAYQWIK